VRRHEENYKKFIDHITINEHIVAFRLRKLLAPICRATQRAGIFVLSHGTRSLHSRRPQSHASQSVWSYWINRQSFYVWSSKI